MHFTHEYVETLMECHGSLRTTRFSGTVLERTVDACKTTDSARRLSSVLHLKIHYMAWHSIFGQCKDHSLMQKSANLKCDLVKIEGALMEVKI